MDLKVDGQYWTVKTVELVESKARPAPPLRGPWDSTGVKPLEVEVTLVPSQTGPIGWGVWIGGTQTPKLIKVRGRDFNEALGNASSVISHRINQEGAADG